MQLIKIENGSALLNEEVSRRLAEFERMAKEIKEKEDELKQAILDEMEKSRIIKIDTGEMAISYVSATTKETFQSKEFRKDHPDLYDDYVKISPVKASVRIKLKE